MLPSTIFVVRVVGHLVGNHRIDRQLDLPAGLGQQAFGQFDLVALDEALADFLALGEEERVGHRAADQERVGFAEQLLDDIDFVGDFGPAEDRDERPRGFGDGFAQKFQFLLNQKPDRARLALQRLRHAECAGVLAVGGAECVVDVNIAQLGQLLGEVRLVLFFFLVEAEVFQQQHFAVLQIARPVSRPLGRCSRWRISRAC